MKRDRESTVISAMNKVDKEGEPDSHGDKVPGKGALLFFGLKGA